MQQKNGAANARAHHTQPSFKTRLLQAAGISLLALSLASPAAAASKPIPVLINAFNLSWGGAGGGNGEVVGLGVDPNTGNVYASDPHGPINSITSGSLPQDIDIDPDVAAIYTANPPTYPESSVLVNRISATAGTGSQGMAIDPKTQTVYIACDAPSSVVYVVSEITNSIIASIPVADARAAAADPDTGKVFVTQYGPGTVAVIDEKTQSVTATIPVGSGPQVPVVDKVSKKVYVTNYAGGTVSVIDEKTNNVIATIPVGTGGPNPYGIAVDSKTGKVYVSNYFDETISVINEKTESVIAVIPDSGFHPLKSIADSSTGTVYVVNRAKDPGAVDGATALVIDESTDTVAGTFNVFAGPRSIALDQKSGLLFVGGGAPNDAASVTIYQTKP